VLGSLITTNTHARLAWSEKRELERRDRLRKQTPTPPATEPPEGRCETEMLPTTTLSHQTGGKCPTSGIWTPDCAGKQIALSKGETFPPCSHCNRAVTWTLVIETK